jgi:flagellar L-ring protein precursor FlgH
MLSVSKAVALGLPLSVGEAAGIWRQARRLSYGLSLACLLLPPPTSADSLWMEETARPMFADKRASNVGDLLTVVVQENNSASKDKNTKTSKTSSMDAAIATFLYSSAAAGGFMTKNGQMPALKYNYKNDFEGGGSINNSESILARIGVRVVDVLPNRNLVIEGTRETAFSGEQQTIVLRGVVNPDNITSGNTVLSQNIADATIKFVSKGALSDSQRKGWFNKIWDKLSPF